MSDNKTGSPEGTHGLKPVERKDGSEGVPARGYSWPPFEPTHGAHSPAVVAAKAKDIHTHICEVAPWLDEDVFLPALSRYLQAAARESLLNDYILRVASEEGVERIAPRAWESVNAATRLAAQLGNALGLDPIGRAKLKKLAAEGEISILSLGELARQGRELREQYETDPQNKGSHSSDSGPSSIGR